MKPGTDSAGGRALLALYSGLIRGYVNTVGRTWRTRVVHGEEALEGVRTGGQPVILTFWHNRSVLAVPLLLRALHRRGHPLTLMASGSRDGEVVARAVAAWGVGVVRGSATRGGREALWGTYRAIRRSGASPVVVPDGPTGPIYHYKAGVLHLARLSGAPLLPLGVAASRYRAIGSWDRLMIPSPFSRIAVAVGEPRHVSRALGEADLEAERTRQEAVLTQLTERAEAHVGRPGSMELPPS